MQWIALYYLGQGKTINQRELATKMNLKESTVVRLVDRMEKDGFVERHRSVDDRRVHSLLLTKKGELFREKLLPEGDIFNNIVSKGISEAEMHHFMKILDKMVTNVKDHMDNND